MAAIDAWLVGTDLLQEPERGPQRRRSRADLPRLQLVSFGSAVMGFGDLFIAATLGALLASDRRLQLRRRPRRDHLPRLRPALLLVDQIPATVPIALTLAALELAVGD